jgi:hypothetical protein
MVGTQNLDESIGGTMNMAEGLLAKWAVHTIGGSASVLEMLASENHKLDPDSHVELTHDVARLQLILQQMAPQTTC